MCSPTVSAYAATTSIWPSPSAARLNIPARYATGYLGDIGVPLTPPMDFSAWFEVYLDNQWWIFDARNNTPRIGRVLIATGRDASDVAITTSFGAANLTRFAVVAEEVTDAASSMPGTERHSVVRTFLLPILGVEFCLSSLIHL